MHWSAKKESILGYKIYFVKSGSLFFSARQKAIEKLKFKGY